MYKIYNKFEMRPWEIKNQEAELDMLENFLEVNKHYINASLEELMVNLTDNLKNMIVNRTYAADENMKEEMKKFPKFEYLANKKRDNRSVTYLIYYVITTQIWEQAIARLLENLGCKIEKTGSNFQTDLSKASNAPDFTVTYIRDGKEVKKGLEVQRANYLLEERRALEYKYSKVDKDVLNYIIMPDGSVKFLLVSIARSAAWRSDDYKDYGLEYHQSLPVCYKKGYYLRKVKKDAFINYVDLLNLEDFQAVLNKVRI